MAQIRLGPPPWATAAAVGPEGERGGIDWGGDTSGYYTKPKKIIQSPKRVYKDITYDTKA